MLKKSLLVITLISSMYSQNIDDVVTNTINRNYTLKALESSISIAKEQIDLVSKWKNPTLTFGITDIQFEDITKRDKEAMQAEFIGFSQVIPMGNKLEIEKEIATNDYVISKYQMKDKKLQFKSNIYKYIYNIQLQKERLSLFEELKKNTKKLEKLLTALYKYNKASQVQILNTQILYQELNLKSQKLKTLLNTTNLKLEQLTYTRIQDIDFNTNIKTINISKDIESHPKILSLMKTSTKFTNISKLEKEKKNSDVKMSLTYFHRDSKFNNYINLAFAIPLSVYGSEDIKSLKAKFKAIKTDNKIKDMKLTFQNRLTTLQQNIDDSIITFNIIKNNIIPKHLQLQKTLQNYNAYNKADTKSLIKNLNEIIKYKIKAIDEKQKYFNALATSYYFSKEI